MVERVVPVVDTGIKMAVDLSQLYGWVGSEGFSHGLDSHELE